MLLPGSVKWHKYFRKQAWMIRDFELTPEQLSGAGPVFLYSFAKAYDSPPKPSLVYLNGEKVGEAGRWSAWDVRRLLKVGENRLAIRTDSFSGRVFLSREEPAVYPYLGADTNRLWLMFQDWLKDAKAKTWEVTLAAMRQVDPNAPIKFMAPRSFGTDRWTKLADDFGGWPHFTGEGVWYFPWYKRYGFLYGLPATTEMAGPQVNADGMFKVMQRTFLAGLNGLDHVFTVQGATRRPEIVEWYRDHAKVIKQMGRYDISGPQVLLYRSTNSASNLMPEPNPAVGAKARNIPSVWNWDIGRGTLQGIGQSYLYIDDGGILDGKLEGYDLLIDGGNEIVNPGIIDKIGSWVEAGGTFVVLPFTARSTPESPDSWPISKLTGCEVKAIRLRGEGSVTMEKNQDIFRELAGKTFPEKGTNKDDHGNECNEPGIELRPLAGAEVLARFDNGEPAIVIRKVGSGRVITLGSAFFKNVRDFQGMWIPEASESVFWRDLLKGLKQPFPNYTNDFKVLAQRYRSNNGLDDVVVLVNFAGEDRTVSLTASFSNEPTRIFRVERDSVAEIPDFSKTGNEIVLKDIFIPKDEVQVFYFRTHTALDAEKHWWDYQNRIWKPTRKMDVDFSPISAGRWVDPVLNLKTEWRWTQSSPSGDSWRTDLSASQEWPKWHLDIFSAVGAVPTKTLYATKVFEVPAAWLNSEGTTRLIAADWNSRPGSLTAGKSAWRLWLNGHLLQSDGFFNPDVSRLLKAGPNVLAIEIDPPKENRVIGVLGAIYLSHTTPPASVVNLAGDWVGTLGGKPVTLVFPGKGKAEWPSRKIMIPQDWKDKYVVTYFARDGRNTGGQGAKLSTLGVVVNEREARRRHHHLFGPEVEVDITSLLRFGEENLLTLLPAGPIAAPVDWDVAEVELRLYPRAKYRD